MQREREREQGGFYISVERQRRAVRTDSRAITVRIA